MKKGLLKLRPKRTGSSAGVVDEGTSSPPESPKNGALESPKSDSDNSNPINDIKLKLDELSLKGKIILNLTFQFLYYVLDDTKDLPVPTIQEFRALQEPFREYLKTRKGRLLLALVTTPSFMALFSDEREILQTKVNKSAKLLVDEASIKSTLMTRHKQVDTNIFLDTNYKPCIPEGLSQTTPGCASINDHFFYNDPRGSHVVSGIHSPFRANESVVNNFVKILALLVELAKTILACNEVRHLAQENDEIFTSTDSVEQILLLMESFTQLCTEADKCRTALSTILAARVRGFKDNKINEIHEDTPWKKNMAQIFSGELNKNKQLSTTSSECIAIIKTAESLLKSVGTKTPRKKLTEGARQKFVKATAQLNEHIAQFLHPRPPAPSFSPPTPQNTHEAQAASLSRSNGAESPRDPEELEQALASKEKKTLFARMRSLSEKRLTKKPLTSDKDLEKDSAESTATTLAETDASESPDTQTTAQKQGQFAKGRSVSVKNMSNRPFRQEGDSTVTLGRARTGSMLSQKTDTGTASPGSSSPRDDAADAASKVDQRSIKTGDMKRLWASRESSSSSESKNSPFLTRKSGAISPRSTVTTSNAGKAGTPETSPRTASNTPQSPTPAKKESSRVARSGTANSTTATPASPPQQRETPVPPPRNTAPTSQAESKEKPGSPTAGLKSEQPKLVTTSSSTTASPPQQRGTPVPPPRSTAPTNQVESKEKPGSPTASLKSDQSKSVLTSSSTTASPPQQRETPAPPPRNTAPTSQLESKESPRPGSNPTSPSLTRLKPPTTSPPLPPSQQGKQEETSKEDKKATVVAPTAEQPSEQKKEPLNTVQTSTSPRAGNQEGEKQEKPSEKPPATTVVVTPVATQVSHDVKKLPDPKASSSKTEEKPKQSAAPTEIDPPKKPESTDSSAISPISANPDSSDTGGVDKKSIKTGDMKNFWAQKTGSSPPLSRRSITTESSTTPVLLQTQEPLPKGSTKPAEESNAKLEIAANNSALPTSKLDLPPAQQKQSEISSEGKNGSSTAANPIQKETQSPDVRAADDSQLSKEKVGTSEQPTVNAASAPPPSDTKETEEPSQEPTSPRNSTASSGRPRAGTGPDKFNAVRKLAVPKPVPSGAKADPAVLSRLSAAKKATATNSPPTSPRAEESSTQQVARPATSISEEVPVVAQPISKDQPGSQENTIPAHAPAPGLTSQSPETTHKQSKGTLHVVTEREKEALRLEFRGGGPAAIGRVAKKTTFTAIGPNVSERRLKQPHKMQSLEEVILEAEQLSNADRQLAGEIIPGPEKTPQKTRVEFFQKFKGTPDKPGKLHTNENIQEVVTALEDNREHEIVLLQNNDIGAFGAMQLCSEFSQQKKLKILCMSNNTKLFHALNNIESKGRDNPHVSVIAFRDFLATHPTLEHLKIDECGLGSFGASILANGLKSNKSLLSLDIRFNDLTDDGIGFICEALMYHPTIESVLISANRLTEEAGNILLELLRTNNRIINFEFFEDADSFDLTREKIENSFSPELTDKLKAAIKDNQDKARASPENK